MKKLFLLTILFVSFGLSQEVIISENFENGIPEDWEVHSNIDKRKWYAKSYQDVHYITMSAFAGKGRKGYDVTTNLVTPLMNLQEKTCKLRFSFADAYQNGQPLQVYLVSEKMKPIRKLSNNDWKDLVNNAQRYDNNYQATPWIPLPGINQPYKIGFTYDSKKENGDIITTTIQLNEVDVWCEE